MKYLALFLSAFSALVLTPATSANLSPTTMQVKRRQAFVKPSTLNAFIRGGQEFDPDAVTTDADVAIPAPEEFIEPPPHAKRMANLKERLVPAVLMLGGVGLLTNYAKEPGLVFLTLVLQVGMYQEMTNVIGGKLQPFMKWWWFLTASLAFNGPRLLPLATSELAAASYAMASLGIVSTIIRLQLADADAASFREFMRQTAISALSTVSRKELFFF